jgi:hypothetical protein
MEFWTEREDGGKRGALSRLEKLKTAGSPYLDAGDSLARGIGIFKTTKGHFIVHERDGRRLSDPALDVSTAIRSAGIDESKRARLLLQCDRPADDLQLANLLEQSLLLPDEIRALRLGWMEAEPWDV